MGEIIWMKPLGMDSMDFVKLDQTPQPVVHEGEHQGHDGAQAQAGTGRSVGRRP